MSAPVIYAFVSDDALKLTDKISTLQSENQGYGVLSGEAINYLVNRGIINDIRKTRLMVLNNVAPDGKISLLLDMNRVNPSLLENLTDVDTILLFNIIERMIYQQNFSDQNIEHMLTNSSSFRGYVPQSMLHALNSGLAQVRDIAGTLHECNFWDTYIFDFETENISCKFHLWISNRAFKTEYPYTTITSVIPPYDPELLLNPIQLVQSGNINVLMTGSTYIFQNMNLETVARDQNGVYTYPTKYRLDATKTLMLPFALPYCGPRTPTSLECRKAIKDYLEKNTSFSTGDMEALFPELYVDSRFYIVPLWDYYKQLLDREVYPSILQYKALHDHANFIFSERDQDFVNEYMEILLNAQNKMFYLALPDEMNTDFKSILKQHPTYQDYATHVAAGFRFMAAETQDFAGKFNRCMAILNGEDTSAEFIRSQIGLQWYLSFTSGKAEYFVMEKLSYMDMISTAHFPAI